MFIMFSDCIFYQQRIVDPMANQPASTSKASTSSCSSFTSDIDEILNSKQFLDDVLHGESVRSSNPAVSPESTNDDIFKDIVQMTTTKPVYGNQELGENY